MDFDFVLKQLLEGFARLHIRYGVIGGFALGALGAPRATRDLDFLVHRDDMSRVHDLVSALSYRRIHHSDNVSQYEGESIIWGGLDFVHAFRALALEMLDRAIEKPIFAGTRRIRVLQPEDLIGMKVQAIANSPDRKAKETVDIEALIGAQGSLDWARVEEFYALFSLHADFKILKERLHHAE